MIDNESYCIDIVHQSKAVQKSLKKLDSLILKDHIENCVIDQAKKGDLDKISKKLLEIYKYN